MENIKVAYFCMEYGLDYEFEIYAGGLGILAGDYLKTAKKNNYPVIGIGILWKQGYTTQKILEDGKISDLYINHKYDFLEDMNKKVKVEIRDRIVNCKIWKVNKFENADLYLLDTDIEENDPSDRWITSQLYGGFAEERLAQEMVLGIGGVRAIRELNLPIDIFHLNEGHGLFAAFELIKEKKKLKYSYKDSFELTKKEVVFTTHTPVKEGNETHSLRSMIYMKANNGITKKDLIELGGNPFNMTKACLKLSKVSNAVSILHKKTADKMWKNVEGRSKILAITNGVDKYTWVDKRFFETDISPNEIFEIHKEYKEKLIEYIYKRKNIKLEKDILTIGFSRRMVPYKRPDLIFKTKEGLDLIKKNKIQIIFSGKSHPLDDVGKKIIQNLLLLEKRYPKNIIFIENYEMKIASILTKGVDLWLNNPVVPKEACGTSGIKAAMNGVLNLSTLDGWWPEAVIDGINGWKIESSKLEEGEERDIYESKQISKILQEEIVELYYNNKKEWKEKMKNSIETVSEKFEGKEMIKNYYEKMYKFKK